MSKKRPKKQEAEQAELDAVAKKLEDFDTALSLVQMASALLVEHDDCFDAYVDLEREIVDARSQYVRERIRVCPF